MRSVRVLPDRGSRPVRHRDAWVGIAALLVAGASAPGAAWAAPPSPAPSHVPALRPSDPSGERASAAPATPEPDAGARNGVARARMLECGHQWSNMKRSGTASGTWKDFSRGCLAQR